MTATIAPDAKQGHRAIDTGTARQRDMPCRAVRMEFALECHTSPSLSPKNRSSSHAAPSTAPDAGSGDSVHAIAAGFGPADPTPAPLRAAAAQALADGVLMLTPGLVGYDVRDVREMARLGQHLRTGATVWRRAERRAGPSGSGD